MAHDSEKRSVHLYAFRLLTRSANEPETGVREMATYNKMNSLGWYYAVRGPEAALLAPKP